MVKRLDDPAPGGHVRCELRRIVFRIRVNGAEALALRRRRVLAAPAQPHAEAQGLRHRIGHVVEAARHIDVESDRRLLDDIGAGRGGHAPRNDRVCPVADRRGILRIEFGHIAPYLRQLFGMAQARFTLATGFEGKLPFALARSKAIAFRHDHAELRHS